MKPSKEVIERAARAYIAFRESFSWDSMTEKARRITMESCEVIITAAIEPMQTMTIQGKVGQPPENFLAGFGLIRLEDE